MSKILVAYFSASGVTARAAQAIAEAVGGDLYEIAPAQPYTAADLDWTNKQSRSSLEMRDTACRPALAAAVENVEQYDTVFVGFPIWWGIEPRAVDTLLGISSTGTYAATRWVADCRSGSRYWKKWHPKALR